MEEIRGVREFVKDLVVRGRSELEVLAVARCSHWESRMGEVKEWLEKRGERWRELIQPVQAPVKKFKLVKNS